VVAFLSADLTAFGLPAPGCWPDDQEWERYADIG
jgi:hypothetical protein